MQELKGLIADLDPTRTITNEALAKSWLQLFYIEKVTQHNKRNILEQDIKRYIRLRRWRVQA